MEECWSGTAAIDVYCLFFLAIQQESNLSFVVIDCLVCLFGSVIADFVVAGGQAGFADPRLKALVVDAIGTFTMVADCLFCQCLPLTVDF